MNFSASKPLSLVASALEIGAIALDVFLCVLVIVLVGPFGALYEFGRGDRTLTDSDDLYALLIWTLPTVSLWIWLIIYFGERG